MWAGACLPKQGAALLSRRSHRLLFGLQSHGGFQRRCYTAVQESIEADENTDLVMHLEKRGLVHTLTSRSSTRVHVNEQTRTVYSGVDPSAASLHVGNLLPLMTLVHFARWGHNPIVLVGGATGSIGDPSGRSTERNALDSETLQKNVAGITVQLRRIFHNIELYYATIDESSPTQKRKQVIPTDAEVQEGAQLGMRAILLNNYTWTSGLTLLDFLSTVGRVSRMSTMLSRESVASRLVADTDSNEGGKESPFGLSFTEFSYQLLQANDFAHLHKTRSCSFQVGGSDQLGNIMAGIELIRRTHPEFTQSPAYGLTTPLLTTASGEKFGKSAGNAVWLDPTLTSDLDFYQFFVRTADEDVERYLLALTLLPLDEIRSTVRDSLETGTNKQRRAQRLLAYHLTTLIRGADAAEKCESITKALWQADADGRVAAHAAQDARTTKDNRTDVLRNLDLSLLENEPGLVVPLSWENDIKENDVTKLLVALSMCQSRSDAKRALVNKAIYINNQQVLANDPRNATKVLIKKQHLLSSLRKEDDESSADPPKYFVLKLGKNGPQKIIKIMP